MISKLKKVQESTIAKTVLSTIAVSALVTTTLVFPSLPYIINLFAKDATQKDMLKRFSANLINKI